RLAIPTPLTLQGAYGRNDFFSAPPDPRRRDDLGGAAGARRAHAGRALWSRPRRPVAVRHPRLHAGGIGNRVVADRPRGLFGRLFHRDADAQRGFRTTP